MRWSSFRIWGSFPVSHAHRTFFTRDCGVGCVWFAHSSPTLRGAHRERASSGTLSRAPKFSHRRAGSAGRFVDRHLSALELMQGGHFFPEWRMHLARFPTKGKAFSAKNSGGTPRLRLGCGLRLQRNLVFSILDPDVVTDSSSFVGFSSNPMPWA